MKSNDYEYDDISRRGVTLLSAGSLIGISGCMGVSANNSSQLVLVRNETTTQRVINLILQNEDDSEDIYESSFTVDPNEEIREEDVASVGNYEYIVESDSLESKEGTWKPETDHRSNTLVIEIKEDSESSNIHVVTVSH